MLGGIGKIEIIVILILLVLFFGGRKIPELTRGITNSISEFRKAAKDRDHAKKTEKKDQE